MSVSTSRVMEYDPFSQEFQADPFPVYRWMRDEAPVFYSEKWNWWALSRFEDVRAAATDPQTFLSYEGIDIDDTAKDQSGPGFLPDIDDPRHDQIRRMIQPQLLPNRIAEREDAVRAVVRGLIDAWRHRGTVDLAQELDPTAHLLLNRHDAQPPKKKLLGPAAEHNETGSAHDW